MQAQGYFSNLEKILHKVQETQYPAMEKAAAYLTECLAGSGMIYTFGTGHSNLLAMELFYRAGGLVRVRPLFDDGMLMYQSASGSSQYERQPDISRKLLDECGLKAGDVLLVISNSGRNCMPVEAAIVAREKGAKVIALTSIQHELSTTPRNPYGKMLHEVADVVLDNCGIPGDASLESEALKLRFAPTSTAVGASILWETIRIAIEKMEKEGIQPEVFLSANVEGGDQFNEKLIEKYKPVIPCL